MAERVVASLAIQIAANTAKLSAGLKGVQSQFSSFTSAITKIGGALGVAFGVQQVADFAFEVSKLAGEFQGVNAAFDRLPNSAKLLDRLKSATHETVSELDLMKRAVQASNFEISLEALPRLLEFATLRAQQTGQSVDYLVDSIVTGIGRKSKLILDNLGISAVQLDQALGGASTAASSIGEVADAVGRIAEDNLKNMAKFSDNASSKVQSLNASWINFKVTLGTVLNSSGLLNEGLDSASESLEGLGNAFEGLTPIISKYLRLVTVVPRTTLKAVGAIGNFLSGQLSEEEINNALVQLNRLRDEAKLAGNQDDVKLYTIEIIKLTNQYGLLKDKALEFKQTASDGVSGAAVESIDSLNIKLKELTDSFNAADLSNEKMRQGLANQIKAVNEQIANAKKLLDSEAERLTGLSALKAKVQELNDQYDRTNINDSQRLNAISQEIQSLSILIKKLEDLKKVRDESVLTKISAPSGELVDLTKYEEERKKYIDGLNVTRSETEKNTDKINEAWANTNSVVNSVAADLGTALGQAATDQRDFAHVMSSTIQSIIDNLRKEALAAIVAKAAITGKNPFAAIAAATLGFSIISGLFSKIGKSSGSGSGPSGSSVSRGSDSNRLSETTRAQQIALTVEPFAFKGADLWLMLKNYEKNSKYTSSSNG